MSSKKQILLWLMIISSSLGFVWYLQTKQPQPPKELSFDAAMAQIKNKDIKEVTVKQDTLELTNKSDVKFTAKLDTSDSTRDQIFAAAKDTDTVIKIEAPSSGQGWLMLVNALPFFIILLPVAIIVALIIGVIKFSKKDSIVVKKCPFCAELIQPEAIVCRFCGRDLSNPVK